MKDLRWIHGTMQSTMRALPHWYLHFIQLGFDSDYRVTSAAPLLGEQIKRQNVDKYCVKKWQILASLKNWQILRPLLTTTATSQLKERKSALSKCPLTSASQCCVKVFCQGNNEFRDNRRNCLVRVSLHLFNSFPNLQYIAQWSLISFEPIKDKVVFSLHPLFQRKSKILAKLMFISRRGNSQWRAWD